MFFIPDEAKIVFYSKPISQLNGIDGLSSVIQNQMGMDPCSGHYFLFSNTKRDRFKILYKDGDNLSIWFKRFSGTLSFTYTNKVIFLDKNGLLSFMKNTSSKCHYTLKNID